MAVALLAVFLAVGGRSAYAAGANFLLNTTNTSTAQTTLNGSAVHGPALQLTNTSKNTNATALALDVNAANPPFTVNSSKKVAKLNADRLDGIDSKSFVQGGEHALANRVSETVPETFTDTPATLLTVPGFGTLTLHCQTSGHGQAQTSLSFTNTSGQSLDVDRAETYYVDPVVTSPGGPTVGEAEQVLASGATDGTDYSPTDSPNAVSFVHVEYQIGTGTGSASRLATIDATSTMTDNLGQDTCFGSSQAITMP